MTETATEISAAGYTNLALGTLISTNWPYLEFRDAVGGKITRIPNNGTSDTRVTRTIVDKKVTFVCAFSGSDVTDADIDTYMDANSGSCTFKTAVLKNTDADGDANIMATDDFTEATIADPADTLTITVNAGVL